MLRKWRIGVVGSGMISEIYLQNLVEKFEETEVLGVWSPREHSRNVRMLQFDLPKKYDTYSQMLKDPEVDIILNLTPPLVHAEITMSVLRRYEA